MEGEEVPNILVQPDVFWQVVLQVDCAAGPETEDEDVSVPAEMAKVPAVDNIV